MIEFILVAAYGADLTCIRHTDIRLGERGHILDRFF